MLKVTEAAAQAVVATVLAAQEAAVMAQAVLAAVATALVEPEVRQPIPPAAVLPL